MKNNKYGITLISLVITIIVMLILAGVVITFVVGDNGIFQKTNEASKEHDKQTATETIHFKITKVQMETYAKEQRMPSLKELSLAFIEDAEIEYVTESSKLASKEYSVTSDNPSSIYTKLNHYPYEFEINSSLQLASIDGIKIAVDNSTQVPDGYIKPQGTIQITTKSNNIDVGNYQYADTTKLYTADEVSSGKGVYWETGTGTISQNNTFLVDNLNFSPNEVWFYAVRPSASGRLIVHATKDSIEYFATSAGQAYYGTENNFSLTVNGFSYYADGWSDATVQWTATT